MKTDLGSLGKDYRILNIPRIIWKGHGFQGVYDLGPSNFSGVIRARCANEQDKTRGPIQGDASLPTHPPHCPSQLCA